jgi:cupin 2 domain-containing protein
MNNIFSDASSPLPDELVTTLFDAESVRIERIVSQSHASPDGFWFDQPRAEWVLVVQGAAQLRFEDRVLEMRAGDFVHIRPHEKHRVDWTSAEQPTIWLAVHHGDAS